MKTCPECGEILGDSINVCFKCRYDFKYKRVITVDDLSTGQADQGSIQKLLSEWSEKGWRLHMIFTNEIGKSSTAASVGGFGTGTNATIDQTILVFERCIKE